jgi:hypothetical protein
MEMNLTIDKISTLNIKSTGVGIYRNAEISSVTKEILNKGNFHFGEVSFNIELKEEKSRKSILEWMYKADLRTSIITIKSGTSNARQIEFNNSVITSYSESLNSDGNNISTDITITILFSEIRMDDVKFDITKKQ